MKKYNKAPLPFNGQKIRWLNTFRRIIEETKFGTYVDLFGGSGLLSHTVKSLKPHATVVYNDFDNYAERLSNIPKTNALLSDIFEITNGIIPDEQKITGECREKILARIKSETGYVDYQTLSSCLLFTMHTAYNLEELSAEGLYSRIRQTPYNADGYLVGVIREKADYREIIERYRTNDTMFIFDPPYLTTDNTKYAEAKYWKLADYLNVVKALKDIDYIYFTSHKSQIEELFEFMQEEYQNITPFSGAQKRSVQTGQGIVDYEEYIYYKIRGAKQHNLFNLMEF
jgi:site-specific DNA-adenine methylase